MLYAALLYAITGVGLSSGILFLFGRHKGGPNKFVSFILIGAVALASTLIGVSSGISASEARIFIGVTLGLACIILFVFPNWNATSHAAWLFLIMALVLYLAVTGVIVFLIPASFLATMLGMLLFVMQAVSVGFTLSYTFEILDVIGRRRWRAPESRPPRLIFDTPEAYVRPWPYEAGPLPKIALQVPCHDEPPEVVAATLETLAHLDYPRYAYQVFVVDNNTRDPALWQPIADLCDRYGFTFLHLEDWPGFKSGALNYALAVTPPEWSIIGIVDADYLVHPAYLRELAGYFAGPDVAFVQTPQDYRDYGPGSTFYQRACYHAYRYFFDLSMPSRAERNAIIFGGTMGLIRRSALTSIGGWDEWCITEDAEASLRLLASGYTGRFVNHSYGRGLMPLEFEALKRQRFRWCFGGIQILRKHWATLMPWIGRNARKWDTPGLTAAQRYHYLVSGVQWFSDVLSLGFTTLLLVTGILLAVGRPIHLPALGSTLVLLPLALWGTSLLRTIWALRATRHATWGETLGAVGILWSLGWVVTIACLQGIVQKKGVFLRTPKSGKATLLRAIRSTTVETLLAMALWGLGGYLLVTSFMHSTGMGMSFTSWWTLDHSFIGLGIFAILQGISYGIAPLLCLLSLRTAPQASEIQRRALPSDGVREWRLVAGALGIAVVLSMAMIATNFLPSPQPTALSENGTRTLTQILGSDPASNVLSGGNATPTVTPGATGAPGATATPIAGATATPQVSPTGTIFPTGTVTLTPTDTPHPGATPSPNPGSNPTPQPKPTPHPHP